MAHESPLRRSPFREAAASAFVEVHCPHTKANGAPCRYSILPNGFRAPDNWHIYAMPLANEGQANGQGLVKHCPSCGGLVEVIIKKAA